MGKSIAGANGSARTRFLALVGGTGEIVSWYSSFRASSRAISVFVIGGSEFCLE